MRLLFVLIASLVFQNVSAEGLLASLTGALGLFNDKSRPKDPCDADNTKLFADVISNFTDTIVGIALNTQPHFVISPYSMWMALAAISEGADDKAKDELYQVLGIPTEKCIRGQFYTTAISLEVSDPAVQFSGKRLLIIDDHLSIDPNWQQTMDETGLLAYEYRHLHPDSSEEKDQPMFFPPQDIDGNSFIIDELNFNGLWTTGFSDTTFMNFYDETGKLLGPVELMTVTRQARLAQLPLVDAKVLELPVGVGGRYTMLIALGVKSTSTKKLLSLFHSSMVVKVLNELTLNLLPINIAIPKFVVQSQFKAKSMLQEAGVNSIWYEPDATRYISDPPALPNELSQQISISLTTAGPNPSHGSKGNLLSGLLHTATSLTAKTASLVGRDFVANKPFTYCLLDTHTKAIIFAGVYSNPN